MQESKEQLQEYAKRAQSKCKLSKINRSTHIALSLMACTALIANPFDLASAKSSSRGASPARVSMAGAEKSGQSAQKTFNGSGSGTLLAMLGSGKRLGECPLKHTDVKASVAGYVAKVSVKQTFHNPFKDKIEAVYTFPLPENAAVDEMTMKIGQRVIKGKIKKKEEAREIYEQAKARGQAASLLDQERPNIFTQAVANIAPGETVEIEIKYVDLLPYETGSYTFSFPTVVGPRFIPGNAIGATGRGRLPDTDAVPDASKITPPLAAKGERAGHDISIAVDIDAGMPILSLDSKLHEIQNDRTGNKAHIQLVNKNAIPNRDFVLSWAVAGDKLQSGYLTHHDNQGGFFTLMLMPPKKVTPEEIAPKEMVFLIDASGSQSGAPLDKAKETLNYIVDHMNPKDTFQVIAFNDQQSQFAERPQIASPEMRAKAKKFIAKLEANGGTWMGPAVEKVFAITPDEHRLRIVTFMTDGFVGNDMEIIGLIQKQRANSRWFPFGTGNSVNRFLIDGIAKEGGGEADYVLLNSPGNVVGKKFYDKISTPLLTDVKLNFNGLEVKEVYPHAISDVWAEKPLYIKGRYLKPGAGTITLTGYAGGKPYKQDLKVNFPENQSANEAIKPIWARAKVDRLMSEDWVGAQTNKNNKELKDEIIKTSLDYHIMTQYTSFVAVEEKRVSKNDPNGGPPRTVDVAVELSDGVNRATTVGEDAADSLSSTGNALGFAAGGGGGGGGASYAPRMSKRKSLSLSSAKSYSAPAMLPPPPMPSSAPSSTHPSPLAKAPSFSSSPTPVPIASGRSSNGAASGGFLSPGQMGAANTVQSSTSVHGRIQENRPVVTDYREAPKPETTSKAESNKDSDEKADKLKESNANKLSKSLLSLLNARTLVNDKTGAVEISNGKVLVKVQLKQLDQNVLKALRELGLEIVVSNMRDKTIIARIKVDKLDELSELDSVLKIEPAHSTTK